MCTAAPAASVSGGPIAPLFFAAPPAAVFLALLRARIKRLARAAWHRAHGPAWVAWAAPCRRCGELKQGPGAITCNGQSSHAVRTAVARALSNCDVQCHATAARLCAASPPAVRDTAARGRNGKLVAPFYVAALSAPVRATQPLGVRLLSAPLELLARHGHG